MSSPPSRLARLPPILSHFLGYRTAPPRPLPALLVWVWSWIGAFCGLSVIMAVFGQARYFLERDVPLLVASYGASAVLIYGAPDAPFSQPRALFGGHFIGALLGTCIAKLFRLLPPARFAQLRWLAAALSCATATVAMQITGTTHPPAGATALLPSVDDGVGEIGWYFLPVVLLSSTLALAVALLVNNVQRRYPVWWFVPPAPPKPPVQPSAASSVGAGDVEGTRVGDEAERKA